MRPLLLSALAATATAVDIFRTKQQAANLLTRQRRDNRGIFEEVVAADLQRECVDEVCSYDEVLEAMHGDETQARAWWDASTKMCMQENTCFGAGTKICINQWRARECRCRDGWTKTPEKDDCSIDVDECATEGWCANGGTCTNTQGGFLCDCPATWYGDRCEKDVNECEGAVNPCQNGGVCTNKENGFECACPETWEGLTCEIDIDECARDNPCMNDSGCINTQGGYECLCNSGYGGQNCHEDYDECANAHCPEGTTCMVVDGVMNQFTCVCPERGCNNLDEEMYLSKLQSVFVPEVVEVSPDYSFNDTTVSGNSTDYETEGEVELDADDAADDDDEVAEEDVYESDSEEYDEDAEYAVVEEGDGNDLYETPIEEVSDEYDQVAPEDSYDGGFEYSSPEETYEAAEDNDAYAFE